MPRRDPYAPRAELPCPIPAAHRRRPAPPRAARRAPRGPRPPSPAPPAPGPARSSPARRHRAPARAGWTLPSRSAGPARAVPGRAGTGKRPGIASSPPLLRRLWPRSVAARRAGPRRAASRHPTPRRAPRHLPLPDRAPHRPSAPNHPRATSRPHRLTCVQNVPIKE